MSEITTEPAGTAGQGEPEPKTGRTYTEDEFNAHTAKLRKAEEAKRNKLEGELARLQEAQKTEAERALDRVRQEVAAEWAAKLQAQTVDAALKVALLERGLPPNAAHLVKAEHELGAIEDIDVAIEATLRKNEWLKPTKAKVPSQDGAPRHGSAMGGEFGAPWTTEKIKRAREQRSSGVMSAKQWAEIAPSIEAALRKGDVTE